MTASPLATCITPTFGRFKFLKEMYWSWLQQDYDNKELVILNDEINLKILSDDPRVTIINTPTRLPGLGAKRNELWKSVSSETKYILPFDDDDLFLPNHIRSLVNALQENPSYERAKNRKHVMAKNNQFIEVNAKSPFFFGASCFDYKKVKEYRFDEMLVEGEDLEWMKRHNIKTFTVDSIPPTFIYRQGMGIVHASGEGISIHNPLKQQWLYDKIGKQINTSAQTNTVILTAEVSPTSLLLWDKSSRL